MDVYFEGNFWGHHGDGEKLKGISINQDFVREDAKGRILALYIGRKGVVLDIGMEVSLARIEAFLEKWPMEIREQLQTAEEIEQFESENPMEDHFHMELTVNGIKLKNRQSCSVCWIPHMFEEMARDDVADQLMQEYQLDENRAWMIKRFAYEWDKKIEPKELVLRWKAEKVSVSGEHFVTKSGCEEHKVSCINPITNEKYQITIYGCEPRIFEHAIDFVKNKGLEIPPHYHELSYAIEPELDITMDVQDTPFRIMDCSDGDNARPCSIGRVQNSSKRAASVTVISGADGPTSVFLGGRLRSMDEKRHRTFSMMHFEKQEEVEWRPVFHIKRCEDMEITIKL